MVTEINKAENEKTGSGHLQHLVMALTEMAMRLHDIYMHGCTGPVTRQTIENLGGGVGITDCIECGGDGDWTKFHPDTTLPPFSLPCVACKGTGRRHVSFYAP